MAQKLKDLKHVTPKKVLMRWNTKKTACYVKRNSIVIPGNPEKQCASHKTYVIGGNKRVDDYYNDPIDTIMIIENKILNTSGRICLIGNDVWDTMKVLDNRLRRTYINQRLWFNVIYI